MEIVTFGAIKFGKEIAAFDRLNNLIDSPNYSYIIVLTQYPDGNGNGRFDVSIVNSDESPLLLPNNWSIKDIKGWWNWNPYDVSINLLDQYGSELKISLSYSNKKGVVEISMLDMLKKIIYVTSEYDSVVEYELSEGDDICDIKKYSDFEKCKEHIMKYIGIYKRYVDNPLYKKCIAEQHKGVIDRNVCVCIDKLLNKIDGN